MKKVRFNALGASLLNGKPPEFDNPHDWSQADMASWFTKHQDHYNMAWNIRCMALGHHMKTYTPEDDPILTGKPPVNRDRDREEKVEYVVWCKYGNEEEASVTYSSLAAAQDVWWERVNTPNLPEVKLKRVTTETVMRHPNKLS